ncbi:MAG: heparinase II/III family protein [Nonlabens ulvanivorans]|uniref:heparinase II/III family protein n=3 Tax=Nonlabens ulvanivorans TaxID=906888 RepID=UPI0032676F7F
MKNALRIYHTIKYLKWKQIKFQLLYRCKALYYKVPNPVDVKLEKLPIWKPVLFNSKSYENGTFCFLNVEQTFENTIDWNFSDYGKLWTYNLNYFEFLNSKECRSKDGYELIKDYCLQRNKLIDGLEPYPVSLRIMNWVKFLTFHQINDSYINGIIANDAKILREHLEFHILANHLLENIFALYMASIFLDDKVLYTKSLKLLKDELNEQILKDGGHFEQSPMYHQIILYRLLDVINFNICNKIDIDILLISKVKKMLSWLEKISFSNGDIPYINDAAPDIAPTTVELLNYAKYLDINYLQLPLSDSGYRKVNTSNYEVVVDVANIASNYQPGHLHSDSLQFIMYSKGRPLFVETGTSTYEKNKLRNYQRSSAAHNTVAVGGRNSYDVWGGFRVGKRSELKLLEDRDYKIKAELNLFFGGTHHRSFEFLKKTLVIKDRITFKYNVPHEAHFHIDYSRNVDKGTQENTFIVDNNILISFKHFTSIQLQKYNQSIGFNKTKEASKIVVTFANQLKTTVEL